MLNKIKFSCVFLLLPSVGKVFLLVLLFLQWFELKPSACKGEAQLVSLIDNITDHSWALSYTLAEALTTWLQNTEANIYLWNTNTMWIFDPENTVFDWKHFTRLSHMWALCLHCNSRSSSTSHMVSDQICMKKAWNGGVHQRAPTVPLARLPETSLCSDWINFCTPCLHRLVQPSILDSRQEQVWCFLQYFTKWKKWKKEKFYV